MARTKEQPGYKPRIEPDPKPVTNEEIELAPAAMPPKVKREITPESIRDAKDATGAQLLDYLVESGTNAAKLNSARGWLLDNQSATAEKCFRYLENAEEHGHAPIALGTLRKAVKWIWGDAWEPESAAFLAPQDELKRLREQVAGLQNELARKNGEVVMLKNQLGYLEGQVKTLGSENDHLKVSRPAADLGPGRNVLTSSDSTV